MERRPAALMELERADAYRVAKDEADPHGWAVVGCDGVELGKVRTMLVDTELMRALYFVCDLTPDRAILLPITYARLDPENCRAIFDVINASVCERLPAYVGVMPTPDEQDEIVTTITSGIADAAPATSDRRQLDRRSA